MICADLLTREIWSRPVISIRLKHMENVPSRIRNLLAIYHFTEKRRKCTTKEILTVESEWKIKLISYFKLFILAALYCIQHGRLSKTWLHRWLWIFSQTTLLYAEGQWEVNMGLVRVRELNAVEEFKSGLGMKVVCSKLSSY